MRLFYNYKVAQSAPVQTDSARELELMKQKLAEAERKLGAMSVKKNVRIDWSGGWSGGYDIGESPDGKTMDGFGTRYFNSGDRYEGEFKKDQPNGTGNKSLSPPPPPNPIKCLLLLLLLLCGGLPFVVLYS